MSADKSGMHRNTASKYLAAGQLPSQMKKPHTWRTRKDPFAQVWTEVEEMLESMPELQAVTIFDYLQDKYPGTFTDGQLRTLQRRVKAYRISHGPEKEVCFAQDRVAGEEVQVDWMDGNSLKVTISGAAFEHKLFHGVFPFSNWEWATIASSESFLSLQHGLQETLFRIGGIPRTVVSDNSSAATHRIERSGKKRAFNDDYQGLLDHLGMGGRTINLGCPHENGDVESMHGHLRRRLKQALLLRGGRDFATRQEYEAFLAEQLNRANANRTQKVALELAALRELPFKRLPAYKDTAMTVGNTSTVRAAKTTYSVPPQCIGARVVIRLREDTLQVVYGCKVIYETLRAERGGQPIDYRHVIGSLVRKPGAFRNYRYREALFPSQLFAQVYERLGREMNLDVRDKEYLRILKLAADIGEERVAEVLEQFIGDGTALSYQAVREACDQVNEPPSMAPFTPDLSAYSALLSAMGGGR